MRPEHVKCVRVNHEYVQEHGVGFTWCRERAEGFVLTGIDHAANLSLVGSRLTVCPECVESISMALRLMPLPWIEDMARGDDPRSPEEAARVEAECLREDKDYGDEGKNDTKRFDTGGGWDG